MCGELVKYVYSIPDKYYIFPEYGVNVFHQPTTHRIHLGWDDPSQGGVPPIAERIEMEVSENVFMPGVLVRSSECSSSSHLMALFDDHLHLVLFKSLVDFNETRLRRCHEKCQIVEETVACHGRICFDPMPDFGYPCPVYSHLQFLSSTEVIPDELPATLWRYSQGNHVKSEPLFDDHISVYSDDDNDNNDDEFSDILPKKKKKIPTNRLNTNVTDKVTVLEAHFQSIRDVSRAKSNAIDSNISLFSCRLEVRNQLLPSMLALVTTHRKLGDLAKEVQWMGESAYPKESMHPSRCQGG